MRFVILLLLQTSLLLVACEGEPRRADTYLGNLDDFSYANRRGKAYVSAAGDSLRFASLDGKFVWVDFAAPWCQPCTPQAKIFAQLEHQEPEVAFVTLLTGDRGPLIPASEATARSWARRFGLNSSRVAACAEMRVVPSHMLFSPEGQLLYWSEGVHSAAQVRAVLAEHSFGHAPVAR